MSDFFKDFDFPSNSFNVFFILNLIFLQDLHSHLQHINYLVFQFEYRIWSQFENAAYLFACEGVDCKFDFTEGTFSKGLAYLWTDI